MRGLAQIIFLALLLLAARASAQLDPVKRDLFQLGYNQPLEGRAPLAAYAFYYHNDPDFLHTNLTLRMAIAPTYLDSELGFQHALGPNTDLALGVAGGGFADSYYEIDNGQWDQAASFNGYGGGLSASVYHRFNPNQLIPLNFVLRGTGQYVAYGPNSETASTFQLPDNAGILSVRTGLRWGGIEPTLFPALAMELSVWYQGQFRTDAGPYGYNGDRSLEADTHLFWGSAALSYTLPESQQNFFVRLVTGTSINPDRLSAYRLGGFLPLAAEYPLSLPGYYFQEFSATKFVLANACYVLPVAPNHRWNLVFNGATAEVAYLPGTGQTGNWLNGVGAGILYQSPSDQFKFIVTYAYGIDAVRSSGRGANSINFLMQVDFGRVHSGNFNAAEPGRWRGWNWILGR
jgi:hypothetical protein